MKQRFGLERRWRRIVAWVPILLALSTPSTWSADAPGRASVGSISDLPLLAEKGEFDQVLTRLRTDPLSHDAPQALALIHDLERYHRHHAEHVAQREAAYASAVDEMSQLLSQEKLEDALTRAVEAQSLTVNATAMLEDPAVQKLAQHAQAAAQVAEKTGNWLDALNIYRLLDLLYEESYLYREDVRRAARHLRVLRLYAPEKLERLYADHSKRIGKDRTPRFNPGSDTWQQRLLGVKLSMLRQTLAQTTRRHIHSTGYATLLKGSFHAVRTLAQTDGIAEAFPSFTDEAAATHFEQGLTTLLEDLDHRKDPVGFFDATSLIDQVLDLNSRTVKLPESVMVYEMTEGAIDVLDEFSAVIWPDEKKNFSRNTQGKFSGVGISISIRDDRLVVVSPLEDTPAHRAGIRAGDVIVTVDDQSCADWTLDQAVREITGPEGTNVKLGIERIGESELLTYNLERAEIVIRSIRGWRRKPAGGWDFFIDPDQRIGYIRLSQFIPQTATSLDQAVNQMEQERGLDALILDLRFNPGGLLSSAVEVADRFLRRGKIVSTVGPDGKQTSRFRARPDHTHRSFPVVILVNEGSASASEIIAGCLQDHDRALIVGARSFGKGSVQDLFHLDNGEAYLKLTTQHYQLPQGRIIHRGPHATKWGIEPDLAVQMTTQQIADAIEFRQSADVLHDELGLDPAADPEEHPSPQDILDQSMDPQLEAAVLILKTRLVTQQITLAHRP